jgi:hypothetical protein
MVTSAVIDASATRRGDLAELVQALDFRDAVHIGHCRKGGSTSS